MIVKDEIRRWQQIKEKKYYAGLNGENLCIGLVHNKKICKLVYETINI